MSHDQSEAITEQQRPAPESFTSWNEYWMAQGMPWRTEPEIDKEQQRYLADQRASEPDIARGMYPFKDVRLNRADIEWLLATHESGGYVGPVDWSDERQRSRVGVDVRGADLRRADLHALPLTRLRAGLAWPEERLTTTAWQDEAARVHLEEANLGESHLEGALLEQVHLEHTYLDAAHLERADLIDAELQRASLGLAHLEGAKLISANLQGTVLARTHLEGALLSDAHMDSSTLLSDVSLSSPRHGGARLADVAWGGVNLARVAWARVEALGDEQVARQPTLPDGVDKDDALRVEEYETAVRANRQLATALRGQGLVEQADRFAYRAQILQRHVLRRQKQWLRYVGSLFLDLIFGYGYRPLRSFLMYLLIVGGFALTYYLLGNSVAPALSPVDAVVFSITSFHGRGFSPGETVTLHNPLTILAASEAIIGLLIEITFIATFTQRFFAR